MLLSEALKNFLIDEEVRGCTFATLRHYRTHIGFFINYYGDKDVNLIVYEDYECYILYLKNKYKESGFVGKKQKLSGRTIKTYASALKTFLKFCFNKGYINTDLSLKIKMPKYHKKIISILSTKEISLLINSFNKDTYIGSRDLLIIAFMLESGLRLSEVVNISVCDVDYDNSVIVVHGKGQKDRIVPLTNFTSSCLFSYLDNYKKYFSKIISNNEMLLKCLDGTDISKNTISLIFRRLRKSSCIENLHPHLLRHTFATMFLLNGGDIANLQIILGHTTLNMVLNYLHIANQISISKQQIYSPITNIKNLNGLKKH